MLRMLDTVISIGKFLTFAPFLSLIPAVFYALDRWMIHEANTNFKEVDDIPGFTKITMMMPAASIWTTLFIAMSH